MKKCLECGHSYDAARPACPKCGAKDSVMSASPEDALKFLDSLKGQASSRSVVDEGARLFQQGNLKGARTAFEKALREDANNAVAHSNLGAVLCKMGLPQEGIPHLEKALNLDPRIEGTADFLAAAKRDSRAADAKPLWKFW